MDLDFLDKSSKMTPLLVRLYDSHKLHSLTKDEKPLARAELTSAVAELFEMELTSRESELIADVLIELMRQAEIDLRQALAERLASMDNIPLRLVLQMANDDIEVAGSILTQSVVLSDLDLIYIIKSKGPEHWQSIARRPAMSDQIINVLVDTGEDGTVENLIKNEKITLTPYALDVVTEIACKKHHFAKPLLARKEVTDEIAQRLYVHVGEALKAHIVKHYDVGESVVDMVDEVVLELTDAADSKKETFMPSQKMLVDAARYKEKGLLTMNLMLGTLRRGQIAAFIAQFSKFTGLTPETVEGFLKQANGQGLAVACRAFEIGKADFISIFLLTNRVHSDSKMVDLKDMTKAINYYTRIKTDVAKSIIKNSQEESL